MENGSSSQPKWTLSFISQCQVVLNNQCFLSSFIQHRILGLLLCAGYSRQGPAPALLTAERNWTQVANANHRGNLKFRAASLTQSKKKLVGFILIIFVFNLRNPKYYDFDVSQILQLFLGFFFFHTLKSSKSGMVLHFRPI